MGAVKGGEIASFGSVEVTVKPRKLGHSYFTWRETPKGMLGHNTQKQNCFAAIIPVLRIVAP